MRCIMGHVTHQNGGSVTMSATFCLCGASASIKQTRHFKNSQRQLFALASRSNSLKAFKISWIRHGWGALPCRRRFACAAPVLASPPTPARGNPIQLHVSASGNPIQLHIRAFPRSLLVATLPAPLSAGGPITVAEGKPVYSPKPRWVLGPSGVLRRNGVDGPMRTGVPH